MTLLDKNNEDQQNGYKGYDDYDDNPNALPDYTKDLLMSDLGLTEDEAELAIEDYENGF